MVATSAQPSEALPLSFQDIEELVISLYDPGHAKKITETEATLKVLQRSPQGWDMGDALLNSSNENVRFFGALTLTVKINSDSAGLSEDDARQLLSKLIHHLVSRPASSLATRKLCSTLAQYFCKPFSTWTQCIRSLAISFAVQQPVLDEALENQPSAWDFFPQLSDDHLSTLLEFTMNLADETKSISSRTDRSSHERMAANAETMEVLLQVSFGRGIKYLSTPINDPQYDQALQRGEKLCLASLKCFTGCVFYAQSEFKESPEKLKYLQSATEFALTCLEYRVDDAMELIAEVLESYPKFFEKKHLDLLWSAITGPWGMEIMKNLDAETVSLARIIVAYAEIPLESGRLYQEPDDPHHQEIMSVLQGLLRYPYAVEAEDEVATVMLEVWSTYVAAINEEAWNYLEDDTTPHWFDQAKTNVFLAVSEFAQKIIYPPATETKSWDEDTKRTFKVFRVDVKDIFYEAYEVLRDAMLAQFVDSVLRALEASDWLALEAGMFCINSLSELLREPSDAHLLRLFEQPLYTVMTGNTNVPAVTRRTAVEMVAALDSFLMRHSALLPQVLTFLLGALAQPSLAHGAAKSFASLCSRCRTSLTGELNDFFQMYEQFLAYQTAEEFTKSKILEGIAAIVQAQDSDDKRLAGLERLFQYVTHDAMQALNVTKADGDPEQGQVLALTCLKCLVGMGKALGAADDEVIDLVTNKSNRTPANYWTQGPGKEIQNQIINLVNHFTQVFPANGEIVETGCNVLRTGFKETLPGPFVLPPSTTIDYIVKTSIQTPRLPHVLDTACCWLASNRRNGSEDFLMQAQRLLDHVVSILQALQHPRTDPEITVGCVEVIHKFILVRPKIFATQHPNVLKGMFDFSIECIKSPEVLPKRAAAALWKDIFELSGSTRSQFQSTGQDIVNHFGPAVVFALMYNVCGEVDFSSLEYIVAALRKVVTSDRNAKNYMNAALAGQALMIRVKDDPNTEGIIRKFIESVTRNASDMSAFKETVKEFWQRCRQMQMQFAPQVMHPGHQYALAPGHRY